MIDYSNGVWVHSKAKGGRLLTLLAISDHADERGEAFPGIDLLAAKTRLSKRGVQYAIKGLVEMGELVILERGGFRQGSPRANLYKITLPPVASKDMKGLTQSLREDRAQSLREAPATETKVQFATDEDAICDTPFTQSATPNTLQIAPQPSTEPSSSKSTEETKEEQHVVPIGPTLPLHIWLDDYCGYTGRKPPNSLWALEERFEELVKIGHTLDDLLLVTRLAFGGQPPDDKGKVELENVPIQILDHDRVAELLSDHSSKAVAA